MNRELAPRSGADALEAVIAAGDLNNLSASQRLDLYQRTCETLGLNPLTRPLEYLKLQGRTIMYVRKEACDQLRKIHSITIQIVERVIENDVLTVVARASTPEGRCDEEIGSVSVAGLRGEALANAQMKALTKAKRRATLSICGLGFLDETETDAAPPVAQVVPSRPQKSPIEYYRELATVAVEKGLAEHVLEVDEDAPAEAVREAYSYLKKVIAANADA
jgi:hypothetical protein